MKKCPEGHTMVIMGNGVKEIITGEYIRTVPAKEYWCRKCQKRYRKW